MVVHTSYLRTPLICGSRRWPNLPLHPLVLAAFLPLHLLRGPGPQQSLAPSLHPPLELPPLPHCPCSKRRR